jgi:hypothetical protein
MSEVEHPGQVTPVPNQPPAVRHVGAIAIGAAAVGALALGAVAVGAVAGKLALR